VTKPKKKFYVVWEGRNPGIYDNWPEASRQVTGYPAGRVRAFSSLADAEAAYQNIPKRDPNAPVPREGVAVDAACSGNPGLMEYRGVNLATGEQLFHQGPFDDATNNIGEFLAIVHALALLGKQGKTDVPIYSDSRNAMNWVWDKQCRTKMERTPRNGEVFRLIERALTWLRDNPAPNPLRKWETDLWGEIPADFGRK